MIEIKCDFCGKIIEEIHNKGNTEPSELVILQEDMCDDCKKEDLTKKWDSNKEELEEEWDIVEKEKRRFFEVSVKNKKGDWEIEKKKDFFGSFFVE